MQNQPAENHEGKIEVGATGGDLRFWRAKEALRHAELRLKTQADATQALEARATAMLGWSVAGVLALGAAVVNRTHAFWRAILSRLEGQPETTLL